jgi:predicted GNAT family N-acyltransferase
MNDIAVRKIASNEDLEQAFYIRRKVFMEEQKVSEADEYDGLDESSTHFLAFYGSQPAGTARWRYVENSVKLERFAVLVSFRGKGVGKELLKKVMGDVLTAVPLGTRVFLHAQIDVVPLYQSHGFVTVGEEFEECNIVHVEMEYDRNR